MQHATSFELSYAGSGSLSHLAKIVTGQSAISAEADLFIDKGHDLRVDHRLVESSESLTASIDLLKLLDLNDSLAIVALIISMRAQQEENLLDKVKAVKSLALFQKKLSMVLDARIMTQRMDCFGS